MTLQNEEGTLAALDQLMNEFYSPNTDNMRIREIETQLESFSSQRDSWKMCIYFMTHSDNHYVCMFAMTSIESTICRQWPGMDWHSRSQLKAALWTHLTEQYASATPCVTPMFLRNKLTKLIVDIARHDWPHFYPDFFNNILQLTQSEQGRILGLVLLRTASEELGKPRDDLSSARRVELSRLMQMHTNPVLQTLSVLLDNIASKQKGVTTTKTPPPSPTHPDCAPSPPALSEATTARPDSREICFEVLLTLQHIFSWVSLTDVHAPLIRTIFHFASSMSYTQDDDNICVLSLSTLSELLYRKAIPPGCEPLLLQLSNGAAQLLAHIIGDGTQPSQLESLSNSFIEKFTEFLQLLVEMHLRRLEAEPNFSMVEFLTLIFRYTFEQTSISQFLPCLDIWTAFLKQIMVDSIKSANASSAMRDVMTAPLDFKYSDIVIGLTTGILNKIQYQHNHSELNELDTDTQENDEESEYQHFISESIFVLGVIAEFAPLHIFNLVLSAWQTQCEIYQRLHLAVDLHTTRLTLNNTDEELRLHCVLKDFATLTQALSFLAACFMYEDDDHYEASINSVKHFFQQLMTTLLYATQHKFYIIEAPSAVISTDLIDVHSNLMSAVTSWCLWPALRPEIRNGQMACEIIQPCIPLITATNPAIAGGGIQPPRCLVHSAALLLLRISNIALPETLLIQPSTRELIQFTAVGSTLPPKTAGILRHALCNIAILQNTNISSGCDTIRSHLLKDLVEVLAGPLRNLECEQVDAQHARAITEAIMPSLTTLVEQYRNHNSAIKKLLCAGLKEPIQRVLAVYPRYANFGEINDNILSLFLTVLDVLRLQLGVDFTRQAVQVFLDVTLSKQNEENVSGMDKLLQILQLIVEEPGVSFRWLLPSVIGLCLQNALPVVSARASDFPDLATALFKLLHSILLHRWQFFNQSQVRLGHSPGASDNAINAAESESYQNGEQLTAILQAFGEALLQSDINIFKLSLNSLENLNSKWKLYHQELFRKQLLSKFLIVLLQTLLHKSHALLADEITLAIYNMAIVDLQTFNVTFLPNFLTITGGLDDHQKETLLRNFSHESDMPTLTQNITRLITDMRCYRICNTSLPVGTVAL